MLSKVEFERVSSLVSTLPLSYFDYGAKDYFCEIPCVLKSHEITRTSHGFRM